jgi:DNA-binding Lrp family transcriptional regulator
VPSAFVLISAELGSEAEVLKKLKKIEGVEEAFTVYGVRDIIAKVDAETMDELKTMSGA